MFKRIAILAAAFVMLIAARRNDYDRELQTNDSREIEGRSAGSERSERADREYPARSDRSTGSTGYDEDAAGSASERVLQRIDPVEVTYDISGIAAEVPEGTDFDGDVEDEVRTDEAEESGDEGVAEEPQQGYTEAETEHVMEYLGDWTISFYCPCYECCGEWAGGPTASGAMPSAWLTAATADLPFGTILYVDGLGEFEVQDRGTDYGWLDIYVSSHDEALANGLQTRAVYIVR